eukprot:1216268-Pyramimonas_sp.AAC.1
MRNMRKRDCVIERVVRELPHAEQLSAPGGTLGGPPDVTPTVRLCSLRRRCASLPCYSSDVTLLLSCCATAQAYPAIPRMLPCCNWDVALNQLLPFTPLGVAAQSYPATTRMLPRCVAAQASAGAGVAGSDGVGGPAVGAARGGSAGARAARRGDACGVVCAPRQQAAARRHGQDDRPLPEGNVRVTSE